MTKLACRYAIVQFMPYPETGEFANAGIVLTCPKAGYFDFRLEKKKYARITHFFEELDGSIYRDSISQFEGELRRIAHILSVGTPQPADLRNLFDHLVHPREAIVRFSEQRVVMADSPAEKLQELFDHYVGRKFATKEYQETQLARRVAGIVNSLKLELPFKEERVGTDDYPVVFPLVQKSQDGDVQKLIKPLYLGQDEPNKIYTHGDLWISKARRLKSLQALPADTLFAIETPDERYERRIEAANAIKRELTDIGIKVVSVTDQLQIQEFAVS